MMLIEMLLRCCLILWTVISGSRSQCLFPEYIQSPLDEFGDPMPWHTKVWWLNLRNAPKLREMQEVFVLRSNIWSQRQNNRWSCDRKSRRVNHRATSGKFGSCTEKYLLYNRTCLTEDRPNRFRVIQYGPGRDPTFLCIRFVKRSENVIQVMEGPIKDINDQDLCEERKLQLDEWPWIAPWRKQVVTCPISGGFSFRTLNKLTNTDFCEEEWRKSRLEIDCAKGDGLNFIAPKGSHCNPFYSKSEESRLYCWAGWKEKYYTFLVVGNEMGNPQFCLRFPRDISSEFSVMVYFSVLCPLQDDGMPPTGIEYHELQMNTLAPDTCVDDDVDKCNSVLKRGQCKKEEKYGLHCERTCDKCKEKTNILNTMCPFSSTVQGSWLFMDMFHDEKVKINQTTLQFKEFGTFVCKERSVFSEKLYKTVTMFNNGCAMRYTCFELQRRNKNVMQFRVGESYRSNVEFETLCRFKDQTLPVGDTYRSSRSKNLILDGRLQDEFCGLSSSIPFNGTIYGESCSGSVTDWDSDGCVKRGVINIKSDNCNNLINPLEYQCLAFISDHHVEQFLITKSLISGNYNCWVLTSILCDHWNWKYRALFKLDSVQCISLMDTACALDSTPEILLYLQEDEKSKYCKGFFGIKIINEVTPMITTAEPSSRGRDNLRYHVPNSDKPSATVYQTDSMDNTGRANARNSHSLANRVIGLNFASVLVTVVTMVYSIYRSTT